MAIKLGRTDNGEFTVTDTTTGTARCHADRDSWLVDALTEVLRSIERMAEGLDRLHGSYSRGAPAKIEAPDEEVPTWL